MRKLWRLLNSRVFAVYLLVAFLGLLFLSALLPNEIAVTAEEWAELERTSPFVYWLSSKISTIYIVRNPVFIAVSVFLFLSTFACTATRVAGWLRTHRVEFEKEKAFSFSITRRSPEPAEAVREKAERIIRAKRWEYSASGDSGIVAQRGIGLGFAGSVIFHAGLLLCFLAAPVTALTVLRGELTLTEGITVPLREGVELHGGGDSSDLPDVDVTVSDLRGVYEKGKYKVDFGGKMIFSGERFEREVPFRVNEPMNLQGYQITIDEFGFSPGVTVEKRGEEIFDYFLNLRHPRAGDYFDLPSEGLKMFILIFPDFVKEGDKLGTRTEDPVNPVILVRLFSGDGKQVAKGLVPLGDEAEIGGYQIKFPELRNWANFIVVKEYGQAVVLIGLIIGTPGLFVRFLSNERRLEVSLREDAYGTAIELKGYSRYYPAFLEKEVGAMAEEIARDKAI